jgi:hypothetical protein
MLTKKWLDRVEKDAIDGQIRGIEVQMLLLETRTLQRDLFELRVEIDRVIASFHEKEDGTPRAWCSYCNEEWSDHDDYCPIGKLVRVSKYNIRH